MEAVFTKAGSYILMIVIGYIFKKKNYVSKEAQQTVMTLIMKITLPAAVVASFLDFTRQMTLLFVVVLGLFMNLLMIGIGLLAARKKTPREKAFYVINYSGYNIGTFTMPYLQSFIGSMGVIVACLYDAGNALMCTGFTYAIASKIAENRKVSVKEFLQKVFSSVPFDVYVVMMFLYFFNIHLPHAVYEVAGGFGQANAFLAMFMIGMAFEVPKSGKVVFDVSKILVIRYAVAVIAAVLVALFLPCDEQVKKIVILVLFAPMSALNVINTLKCNGDGEKAGAVNSISILISLIIITALIQVFF